MIVEAIFYQLYYSITVSQRVKWVENKIRKNKLSKYHLKNMRNHKKMFKIQTNMVLKTNSMVKRFKINLYC
jgi:hypothetical protein